MAMSSEAVYKMAQELHESDTNVVPETDVKEEMQPEIVETNDTNPENDNVSDDTTDKTAQETVVESVVESVVENKPASKKYTKKEQTDYAFAKLKNKEKQKREKLEARIKELEEINKRYAGLNLESFNNDQSKYTDYLVNQRMNEIEKNRLLDEQRQSQIAEYEVINQNRIEQCFPDENDRNIYNKLVEEHASDFVKLLDKADPDGAILSYLDDSDNSPLLIRILMTKPEYRNEILSKSNPYTKVLAMQQLEQKVINARQTLSTLSKRNEIKNKIPVIGSVTKSESTSSTLDKNSPDYWNNRLHEMNKLRGR